MGWRTVVVTGIAKLEYKLGYLVVRKTDITNRVHISEIDTLIIETTSVSLTAALLCELVKAKCKVIFCDEQHNPISQLHDFYGSHDTSAKVRVQVRWTAENKATVWTEIVRDKILKQANHLKAEWCNTEAQMLYGYAYDLRCGDSTNREGHAAKVYFNALFGMDFSRSQGRALNAALDYGYSILLSYFAREIVNCGYITQLGLSHSNTFNPYNLASDLMEPFRILVDRRIKDMSPAKFEKEEKREILDLFHESILIHGHHESFANAVKTYSMSVFNALENGDISLLRFYDDEL